LTWVETVNNRETGIRYVPAGQVFILLDDIQGIVEHKDKNICEIYLGNNHYCMATVIDDYDSIIKKIAEANGSAGTTG